MIEARRLPVDAGQIREFVPRALLVLLVVVSVAVLYDRPLLLSGLLPHLDRDEPPPQDG